MPLADQPRFPLAVLPTPLQEAPRLREALGGQRVCPRIFIKRDDLTGLAFGGNKARKLEFLVGEALSLGATVLVTTGAVQSNHARMTAAAACVAGLKSLLLLRAEERNPVAQGNLLLDHLLGAEIHLVLPSTDANISADSAEAVRIVELMEDLKARGERPYLIPTGGSCPVGVFGYIAGSLELLNQLQEVRESPGRLYYANGSRGTQAGLVLAAKMFGACYRPYGIDVSTGAMEKLQRVLQIGNEAAQRLGVATRISREDLSSDEGYIGSGYGVSTPACLEAIRLSARCEGLFLDPVYSGKAMAGLIDHIRRGLLDPSSSIIFLHTGGTPALFAHVADFGI
jgi:D-cysteine desulfhydrase family pyridoxal phosphate-dependent enzyme